MRDDHRTAAIWIVASFLLGGAVTALGVYASARPSLPENTRVAARGRMIQQCANLILPQRLNLTLVKKEETNKAFDSMAADAAQRAKLELELAANKLRLVWLTIWDWDTVQSGDTVSILSDGYRRLITLTSGRQTIAIPEPKSGYIELRGEVSEDGIIAISLLSGAHPVALPHMTPGQTMKIEIDSAS